MHYRQAWVESVFSALRGNQSLNRFRRKGLESVQTEFGLHVLGYNPGKLLAFLYAEYIGLLSKIKAFGRNIWVGNQFLALVRYMNLSTAST